MKKVLILTALIIISQICFATDKYAGEIFMLGAGVKNFALGNTGVANPNSPAIAYWNSSLMNKSEGMQIELMHAEEYSGLLNYDTFSILWGKSNRFSIIATRIGINDIPLTKLPNPDLPPSDDNKPYAYKNVNNSDLVLYFGLCRSISENWTIGLTPKFAYRTLAEETAYGFGADISSSYEMNKNWLLGFKVKDFFTTKVLWENGTHETVNPGFDIESNMTFNFPIFNKKSNFLFGIQGLTEGREESAAFNIGNVSLDYHTGLAIQVIPQAELLLGYDIENPTAGLAISYKKFNLFYSFEQNSELDNSHRISIGMNLPNK